MGNIEDEGCNMDDFEALRDLGQTALAGRSVLRDHHLNQSGEHFNTSRFYLTMVVLNHGNIIRPPIIAGRRRYPRDIRDDHEALMDNLVLPY